MSVGLSNNFGTRGSTGWQFISLRAHNILDYVIGSVLIISPYIFGFSDVPAATNTFVILGLALIGYSLFTRYNYSVAKLIPVRFHMGLDVALGIVLLIAPSVFNYRGLITDAQFALHVIYGIGAIGLVIFTNKTDRTLISVIEKEDTEFKKVA